MSPMKLNCHTTVKKEEVEKVTNFIQISSADFSIFTETIKFSRKRDGKKFSAERVSPFFLYINEGKQFAVSSPTDPSQLTFKLLS